MDYNYILQNLKQENFEDLKQKLENIQGVKALDIVLEQDKVKLCYNIEKNISEYDVFVEIDKILQQENIDISFEDEKPIKFEDKKEEEGDKETETQQEKQDKKKKNKLAKLPDYTFRLAQIVLAVIFYLILASKAWVVSAICLVLVSYEIFYDTLTDVYKKKITDNLVASISVIILALLNQISFAFMLAVGFSLVKIISMAIVGIFRKKNYELCYLPKIEKEDGQEIEIESILLNDKIIVSDKVYLKCKIVEGSAEVIRSNGEKVTLTEGDILEFGDKLLKKQTLVAQVLETFDGELKDKKELQQNMLQGVENCKCCKRQTIIYSSLAIASLLYIFIKPFFAEYYLNGLIFDSLKAVVILALSFPILNFWHSARQELLIYKLNKNITFSSLSDVKNILNAKGIVYHEDVVLSNGEVLKDAYGMLRELKDLGVESQTMVSQSQNLNDTCNTLKLKNRLNKTSGEEYENLIKDSLLIKDGTASVNGEKVFEFNKENIRALPKTFRVTKRAKLIKKLSMVLGITIQVAFMVLSLSGLVSIGWCLLGALILIGLVGFMQLLELVEL